MSNKKENKPQYNKIESSNNRMDSFISKDSVCNKEATQNDPFNKESFQRGKPHANHRDKLQTNHKDILNKNQKDCEIPLTNGCYSELKSKYNDVSDPIDLDYDTSFNSTQLTCLDDSLYSLPMSRAISTALGPNG